MGKGRKAPKKYEKMDWNEKAQFNDDMMEKYGLDRIKTNQNEITGRGGYDSEAESKAIARAMANDYDTRRSIEAAQLAGNKKANKLGKGISNISEAVEAERFMAKTHSKRMGSGGEYSSANDEGGVADYWVNKDRNKQNSQFATKDDLSALQKEQANAVAVNEEPYKESEGLTKAKERVQAWEDSNASTNPSPYERKGLDFQSMAYGANSNKDASSEPANGEQAQGQLDKFKQELKERKNIQPVF